jgi:hypothetical protein
MIIKINKKFIERAKSIVKINEIAVFLTKPRFSVTKKDLFTPDIIAFIPFEAKNIVESILTERREPLLAERSSLIIFIKKPAESSGRILPKKSRREYSNKFEYESIVIKKIIKGKKCHNPIIRHLSTSPGISFFSESS